MPAPTVRLNLNVPPELAEALDDEARRSGRTKTDIVVAGLRKELAKMTTTTAHDLVAKLNSLIDSPEGIGDASSLTVADDLGLTIDRDATDKLVELLPDSDPVALADGTFVRYVYDSGRYAVADEAVAEDIANPSTRA